jgi:hypothetical protein
MRQPGQRQLSNGERLVVAAVVAVAVPTILAGWAVAEAVHAVVCRTCRERRYTHPD